LNAELAKTDPNPGPDECQNILTAIIITFNTSSETQALVANYVSLSGHSLNDYGNF